MQQSIIRPKQAAALFGVSLSTLWNWNNPKHWLYGLQRPHLRTAAGGAQHRLHHGTDKKPVRPNRETRALLVNAGGQGMNILKLDYQGLGETSRAPDDWRRRHYELSPIPSLKQH